MYIKYIKYIVHFFSKTLEGGGENNPVSNAIFMQNMIKTYQRKHVVLNF